MIYNFINTQYMSHFSGNNRLNIKYTCHLMYIVYMKYRNFYIINLKNLYKRSLNRHILIHWRQHFIDTEFIDNFRHLWVHNLIYSWYKYFFECNSYRFNNFKLDMAYIWSYLEWLHSHQCNSGNNLDSFRFNCVHICHNY